MKRFIVVENTTTLTLYEVLAVDQADARVDNDEGKEIGYKRFYSRYTREIEQ